MSFEAIDLIRRGAAAVALITLCACGGGGGGGGAGGGAGGGGPDTGPPQPNSLIPAAPALGAVLLDDATLLRPLRDQAMWVYQGTTSDGTSYSSRVTVGGAGPVFTEARHSLLDGDSTSTVTVANGTVTVRESIDLTEQPQEISYVELRSPVRQGDQVTLFERGNVALDADIDGDNVNDTADIAAYSRVVGWEDVTLPALSRSVRAVRVDTTLALRITGSRDQQVQPITSAVQSIWYLPRVGVVRLRATLPSSSGTGSVESDESLSAWDGVTQGLGTLSPVEGRLFVDGVPSGLWVGRPLAAAGLGDRALVVSARDSSYNAVSGATVSMISARGVTQTVTAVAGFATLKPVYMQRIGAASAGLIWTERDDADRSGNPTRIRMLRFAANGSPLDAVPGRLLADGADATEIATAYDGTSMWLLWTRYEPRSSSIELVARAFDADGAPASPIVVVSRSPNGGQTSLRLSARAGRVLASWAQNLNFSGSSTRFDVRFARLDAAGLLQSSSLGTTDFVAYEALNNAKLAPLLTTASSVLAWSAPIFAPPTLGADLVPRGLTLTLTADWSPAFSTPSLPDEERLPALALARAPAALAAAVADRVVFAQTDYDVGLTPQVPGDRLQLGFAVPSSPLTASSFSTLRWTARSELTFAYFGSLEHIVALDDRVLLLGHSQPGGMMAAVAWPN